MRIARLKKSARQQDNVRRELDEITRAEPARPPVCSDECTKFEDKGCHMHCPDAPAMLSSEIDYPLEPKITPVVFELKRLAVFHPCWSCEGHEDKTGKLWKVPRVWFYAQSVVHVRLLADSMAELYLDGKLNASWEVVLTVTDTDNTDTSFSLQPNLKSEVVTLRELHQDLESIAAQLRQLVIRKAEELAEHTGGPEKDRIVEKPNGTIAKLFGQLRAGGPR